MSRRTARAARAGLYVVRGARAGLILGALFGILAAAIALCVAGDPAAP